MIIQTFSPLQASGLYYLNQPDFESKLFFESLSPELYFNMVRYDWNDLAWKVIYSGKLVGYLEGGSYMYRTDFDKFIKIEQKRELNFDLLNPTEEYLQYSDLYTMTSKVSIIVSELNQLIEKTSLYTTKTNGEIWLNSTPSSFDDVITDIVNYTFIDKDDSNLSPFPRVTYVMGGTWLPVTSFTNEVITYAQMFDKTNNVIGEIELQSPEKGVGRLGMIYISFDTHHIEFYTSTNSKRTRFLNETKCCNKFYYYSQNGTLEIIYTEGNQHPNETTTKEYLTIGNKQYPIKISTYKKFTQNTGFRLNQLDIFEMIKSPYMFQGFGGDLEQPSRNLLPNSEAVEFTANITGSGQPVLMTNEEDKYYRMTPTANVLLNVKGANYTYDDEYYIASTYVRCAGVVGSNIKIYISNDEAESGKSFFIQPNVWTRIYTQTFQANGSERIMIVNLTNPGLYLDVKKVKIEKEYENYLVFENNFGILYRLEKGGVPTAWDVAIEDSNAEILSFKRYLIENNTFDGFVGSKLSQKNIELVLSDEKEYKRKTNINLGFFD